MSLVRPGMMEDVDEFDDLSQLEGAVLPTIIVVDGEEAELVVGGPISPEEEGKTIHDE